MTTKAQAAANAQNARKSTGPRSEAGKGRSRLNGLVHGLRAEEVVIPGEDPAEFEAERAAWFDEFRPVSQARAALVERAVVAAWRCRRCVRIEARRLTGLADHAIRAHHSEAAARVADAVARLTVDPRRAVADLRCERRGCVRLIDLWTRLLEQATSLSDWVADPDNHSWLLILQGVRDTGTDAEDVGPAAIASWRLLVRERPDLGESTFAALDDRAAAGALGEVRDFVEARIAELEDRVAGTTEPEEFDRRIALCTAIDVSVPGKLIHRYEMAHDRSLRASIAALIQLDRSGIDLAGAGADDEPASPKSPPPAKVEAPSEPIGPISMEEKTLQPVSVPRPVAPAAGLPTRSDFDAFFAVEEESPGSSGVFRDGLLGLLGR